MRQLPGYPASADRMDEHQFIRKTYMCSICLPQSGQAPASHVSQPHQQMLHCRAASLRAMQANPFIHDVNQQNARSFKRRNWSYEVSTAICRNTQRCLDGGARRDRTDDLKLAKLPLSQLSYGPVLNPTSRSRSPDQPQSWWAWEDLNFRPHAYQARALTN